MPPIGEDPASSEPFQHELNRRIEEFSFIVQETSQEQATAYVPLYESIRDQIAREPFRAFTQFSFLPFYRDAFRTMVLPKTPDQVAQLNGWRFHSDGVHLNSRSGLIVADLVQEFIEKRSAGALRTANSISRFESNDSV